MHRRVTARTVERAVECAAAAFFLPMAASSASSEDRVSRTWLASEPGAPLSAWASHSNARSVAPTENWWQIDRPAGRVGKATCGSARRCLCPDGEKTVWDVAYIYRRARACHVGPR